MRNFSVKTVSSVFQKSLAAQICSDHPSVGRYIPGPRELFDLVEDHNRLTLIAVPERPYDHKPVTAAEVIFFLVLDFVQLPVCVRREILEAGNKYMFQHILLGQCNSRWQR